MGTPEDFDVGVEGLRVTIERLGDRVVEAIRGDVSADDTGFLDSVREAIAWSIKREDSGPRSARWQEALAKLGGITGDQPDRRVLSLMLDVGAGAMADVEREESRVVDAIDRLTSTIALSALCHQYPGQRARAVQVLEVAAGLKRPRPPKGRPAVVLTNDETADVLEAVASQRGIGNEADDARWGMLLKKLSAALQPEKEAE